MASSGELVRATGLCSLCDYKFVDEIVARYPASSMPGGWAYIQIRHLDADEIKALRVVLPRPVLLTGRPGGGAQDAERLGRDVVAVLVHVGGEAAQVDERERAGDAATAHAVVSRAWGMAGGALR
jgi:hypothetical protein